MKNREKCQKRAEWFQTKGGVPGPFAPKIQALPELGWPPPHPLIQASWAIWPIISRKCDSRQFSTKVRKSFLRVKMLNRCGFWGKKGHFCGEIITFGWWMITFEGPQCMWTNPSQKSRQGSDPLPHSGNVWILGVSGPYTPPLVTRRLYF